MVACDAVAAGFVKSLAHPGGNLTGVTCINSDLAAKRLEMLKEMQPALARVGAIAYTGEVRVEHELAETRRAASRMNLAVTTLAAKDPVMLKKALAQARSGGNEAIVIIKNNGFTFFNRKLIGDTALRHKLATVSNFSDHSDAGALLTYGPNLPGMARQATEYVAKILTGATPGDLPVAQATRFELVVNKATARALNLTIPQTILLRADRVIE